MSVALLQPERIVSPGSLRVVKIDAQSDPRWEAFVTSHPDGLVYHHAAWLRALEAENGQKPLCLLCEDADGQVRGVLPLLHTRGLPFKRGGQLTGRRLSSLPRTPVAGPLALDDRAASALVQAAIRHAGHEQGAAVLQLKVWSEDGEPENASWAAHGLAGVPWRLTYTVQLPDRPENLRFGNSRNHGRIKWAVNKAAKMGVKIREAQTEDDLRAWYVLYLETMRRHSVPPRPYGLFRACWRLLRPQGLMTMLLAEQDEAEVGEESEGEKPESKPSKANPGSRLIAGSIFLMSGKTVFYAFNGSHRDSLSLRPNDAILWQAMHDACSGGYRYFDFGEVVEDNEGLAEFKSKWGAEPRRLYRYYYPAPDEMEPDSLETRSRAREIINATWQRLPLKVTVLLGKCLHWFLAALLFVGAETCLRDIPASM